MSDLWFVTGELIWKLCESVTANSRNSLTILRVFEDPGANFFDLEDDFLVALSSGEMQIVPLYFRYKGKVYNLVEQSRPKLPSKITCFGEDLRQHEFIAIHCIRTRKQAKILSPVGIQYATKYWTKHAYLAGPTKGNSLKELPYVISQTMPLSERDHLYQEVLMTCPLEHRVMLLHYVAFAFLRNPAFEGVSLLEAPLGLPLDEADIVVQTACLILTITTTDPESTIRSPHHSFGDFIFDQARSGHFSIDRQRESLFFATKCIGCMDKCEMRTPDEYAKHFLSCLMLILLAIVYRQTPKALYMPGIPGFITANKPAIHTSWI